MTPNDIADSALMKVANSTPPFQHYSSGADSGLPGSYDGKDGKYLFDSMGKGLEAAGWGLAGGAGAGLLSAYLSNIGRADGEKKKNYLKRGLLGGLAGGALGFGYGAIKEEGRLKDFAEAMADRDANTLAQGVNEDGVPVAETFFRALENNPLVERGNNMVLDSDLTNDVQDIEPEDFMYGRLRSLLADRWAKSLRGYKVAPDTRPDFSAASQLFDVPSDSSDTLGVHPTLLSDMIQRGLIAAPETKE